MTTTMPWIDNENPHIERRHRAKTLGWRYVSGGACPLKLVGKRCRQYDCLCGVVYHGSDHPGYYRLNDHGATWRDVHGTRFVLWEPYGADVDDLVELAAAARQYGLSVRVIGSVYFPMRTVGIVFTRAESRPVWIVYPWQVPRTTITNGRRRR